MKRVPVTVLTGFLGSGKTTLVNRLLKERPSTRFGLVANEFGEAAIESQLLETRREPLFELPSGCLCCVSDGELTNALKMLVKQDARVEHILVEASGLSSPGPMLGVLTGEGEFYLSGVFGVADASSFLKHERDFAAVRRQLAFADAVLLTKTDLCSDSDIAAVRARLAELRPGIKVLDTSERLPWSVLFAVEHAGGTEASVNEPRRRFFSGGTHHDAEVLEYETAAPLDPDKVRGVFESLDPGILRAKGVLHLGHPSGRRYKYLVQYTGAQKQLYSRKWAGEPRKTTLVFLGSRFDPAALRARLDGCVTGTAP